MPVGRVNGVELYWEQRGSGPRLLFCNGSGLALQNVRPLLDPLAASSICWRGTTAALAAADR
jgi:hypothetical protein